MNHNQNGMMMVSVNKITMKDDIGAEYDIIEVGHKLKYYEDMSPAQRIIFNVSLRVVEVKFDKVLKIIPIENILEMEITQNEQ